MDKFLVFVVFVCFCKYESSSLNLPGPMVYVVTPSPRPSRAGEAHVSPFYYHNWMRRMDSPQNVSTTTTPTPDLIFAEFETGNNMKSIRKLLEREKISPQTSTPTSTTARPIYVPDESNDVTYTSPVNTDEKKEDTKAVDMTDYFALYNNLYNPNSEAQAPVYTASTTISTSKATTTTLTPPIRGPAVENIWHIIDSQKHDRYSGQWEEEQLENDVTTPTTPDKLEEEPKTEDPDQGIDENFALPG